MFDKRSVYTKDLQPLNKPTFYCMDKTLVTVKGGSCLPLNSKITIIWN